MQCVKCHAVMPFNAAEPHVFDCLFCDARQYPDALDLLSEPALAFVKETRAGQIKMCGEINDAVRDGDACIFEAGTGVGKSFAYLLPAVLSGKRVVISTAKKALQTQLLEKDLPRIKQYLREINHPHMAVRFAGAWGRSNFACYLESHKAYSQTGKWTQYETFFKQSKFGHWDDAQKLHLKLDQSKTAENCIQLECTHYKYCGFIAARKDMLDADIIVTNNWILGYHYLILKDDPNRKLLGDFDYLIVDEAHKIEDGIRSAFTNETTLKHVDVIYNKLDALNKCSNHVVDDQAITVLNQDMQRAFAALAQVKDRSSELTGAAGNAVTQVLGSLVEIKKLVLNPTTLPLLFKNAAPRTHNYFAQRLNTVRRGNDGAEEPGPSVVGDIVVGSVSVATSVVNSVVPTETLANVTVTPIPNAMLPGTFPNSDEDQRTFLTLDKLLDSVDACYTTFNSLISPRVNRVWTIDVDMYKGRPTQVLRDMPVEIGGYLPRKQVTYVSATLALNGTFDTFAARVGLNTVAYKRDIFESPFNLKKQAYLYIPRADVVPPPPGGEGGYSPVKTEWIDAIGNQIQELITASQGDALVLFTAIDDLKAVQQYLAQHNYPYPVISQNDYNAVDALELYKRTDKATLLGLKSFWEGIDIQGKKLFMVIIPKLPMPIYNDPIIAARTARYDSGYEGFMKVNLPEMLVDLRQGVGRLIRSQSDRGIIAILDTRIYTKKYGQRVLNTIGLTPKHDLVNMCTAIRTRHTP